MLIRSKNKKKQVVLVVEFKSAKYMGIEIPLLREREVANIGEVICMSKLKYVTNDNFGSIYFVHYINDVLSRKHDFSGLSNMYLIRYAMLGDSNQFSKIEKFQIFLRRI